MINLLKLTGLSSGLAFKDSSRFYPNYNSGSLKLGLPDKLCFLQKQSLKLQIRLDYLDLFN